MPPRGARCKRVSTEYTFFELAWIVSWQPVNLVQRRRWDIALDRTWWIYRIFHWLTFSLSLSRDFIFCLHSWFLIKIAGESPPHRQLLERGRVIEGIKSPLHTSLNNSKENWEQNKINTHKHTQKVKLLLHLYVSLSRKLFWHCLQTTSTTVKTRTPSIQRAITVWHMCA